MRVLEAGSGRPVVLLHPFPLDAGYWAPQLAAPPQGWRLHAPDFRGFGTQAAGDEAINGLDDYARDVIDLIAKRRLGAPVVMGVSMGGYVAMAMLRLAPERIGALVLANTRMDADPPEGLAARRKMLDLLARDGSAGVAREMPPLLGETTEQARPALRARVKTMIESASGEAMAAAVRAMMARPDSREVLAAFAGPALILSGAEDRLTPPPLQQAIHETMAGSTYEIVPHAGHLATLERPAAVDGLLQRFLQGVPA